MAEVRREPRFADIEVLAPAKGPGASARLAVDHADISDAVFETVGASTGFNDADNIIAVPQKSTASSQMPGIDLLRQNVPFHAVAYADDSAFSPGFLAFTLFSTFGVFWLCGGHALLY